MTLKLSPDRVGKTCFQTGSSAPGSTERGTAAAAAAEETSFVGKRRDLWSIFLIELRHVEKEKDAVLN